LSTVEQAGQPGVDVDLFAADADASRRVADGARSDVPVDLGVELVVVQVMRIDRISSDFRNRPPARFTSRREPRASASWSASTFTRMRTSECIGPERRRRQLEVHRIVHAAHPVEP
jgi:hypothetical protein